MRRRIDRFPISSVLTTLVASVPSRARMVVWHQFGRYLRPRSDRTGTPRVRPEAAISIAWERAGRLDLPALRMSEPVPPGR